MPNIPSPLRILNGIVGYNNNNILNKATPPNDQQPSFISMQNLFTDAQHKEVRLYNLAPVPDQSLNRNSPYVISLEQISGYARVMILRHVTAFLF